MPSYHHHVDERDCERGQGWGQTRTQGRGRGHVRGSRRVSSPGTSFFRVFFFFFIFTDDYLQIYYYTNRPRYKDERLRTCQNASRGSLLPPFLSPKKRNSGHVKTCLEVLSFPSNEDKRLETRQYASHACFFYFFYIFLNLLMII